MMWLIDFFKEIAEVIYQVLEFVWWLIQSVIEALALCGKALATVGHYATELPAIWIAPFVAIITIAVIFKVKG